MIDMAKASTSSNAHATIATAMHILKDIRHHPVEDPVPSADLANLIIKRMQTLRDKKEQNGLFSHRFVG
jgi:hypothetical protein